MDYLKQLEWIADLGSDGHEREAITALGELKSRAEREHRAFHRQLLKILDRTAQGETRIEKDALILRELLKAVDSGHISERLVRFFTNVHDYSESFRDCMVQRNGTVKKQRFAPERLLSREKYRTIFADAAKILIPQVYQFAVPPEALSPRDICVIKPLGLSGSRGINIIESVSTGYRNRLDNSVYTSWPEFTSTLAVNNTGHKTWDGRWVAEELIESPFPGEPSARDVKMYVFYGEVALILEISRWGASKGYTWYDRNLKTIDVGIYSDADRTHPLGLESETFHLDEAERISSLIPAPFVRLDFLLSKKKRLVLGELSFRPGAFHSFSPDIDQKLGSAYKRAEARLQDDLLTGRTFPEYEIARLEWERTDGSLQ